MNPFETLPKSFSFNDPTNKLETILSSNGSTSIIPRDNSKLKRNTKKSTTTSKPKTYARNHHHNYHHSNNSNSSITNQANNISFDNTNSTTSSTNNLSESNLNDESASETSGRFTGASNTLNNEEGMSPNSSNNEFYKNVNGKNL